MLGIVSVAATALLLASGPQAEGETVVLSDPQDPYRPLALEIAAAESLPIVDSLSEIASIAPVHVLWVTAPASLSNEAMVQAGRFLRDHRQVAIGLITGSTREDARALWMRSGDVAGTRAAHAIAKHPHTGVGIPIGLVVDAPGGRLERLLTKETFAGALSEVDYLTFAGHGGPASLGLPDGTRFESADIPPLSSVVVATSSCNALRPWAPQSQSVAFVDNGAAAFAGFAFSPIAGYLLGQYRDLALRYTWPGFTVGQAISLQSLGTLKGFARLPYYFLVGDPRLHLSGAVPYRVARDGRSEGERVVELDNVAGGVVPVRIRNGAGYNFVQIPGLGSVAATDRFYNGRIQMMDWGEDKLLLVVQQEPTLTIRLRRSAPPLRIVTRSLTDALDHTFVFLPQTGIPAPLLGIVVLGVVLLWGHRTRREEVRPLIWRALLAGSVLAAVLGLYMLGRRDDAAITSKAVTTSVLVPLDLLFMFTGATLIFGLSCSWRGRTVAFLVGALPALGPALFSLAGLTVVNVRVASMLGTGLYSHHMGILSSISLMLLTPPLLLGFRWAASGSHTRIPHGTE